MCFTYGLAVVLVIFEGIIIQCEGAPRQKYDGPFFPDDVIELIFSKTDFERIQEAAREKIVRANGIVMSRILQDRIILILPEADKRICGNKLGGVTIGNYKGLESFFEKFGDQVKKISIKLGNIDDPRGKITQNIIKRYAKNFEDLQIIGFHLDKFFDGISDGENVIIFPEVKKFQFKGEINRNNFKLNLIFPKLEHITLLGKVADVNCFANVKGLKELGLFTNTIEEGKLDGIFANNENMTRIGLTQPRRIETITSIAKHLTKLETLVVLSPGKNFLLRPNNGTACKLPSVTHLSITFHKMGDEFEIEDLSLNVPHLKKLTLYGYHVHDRIVNFINLFKELEILELFVKDYDPIECIEQLKHIREFTTDFYENRFDSLKNMFENFDKKSKLQTFKFLHSESLHQKYEKPMEEFNIRLENPMKPTWTLSQENDIETSQNYLVFRRDP